MKYRMFSYLLTDGEAVHNSCYVTVSGNRLSTDFSTFSITCDCILSRSETKNPIPRLTKPWNKNPSPYITWHMGRDYV